MLTAADKQQIAGIVEGDITETILLTINGTTASIPMEYMDVYTIIQSGKQVKFEHIDADDRETHYDMVFNGVNEDWSFEIDLAHVGEGTISYIRLIDDTGKMEGAITESPIPTVPSNVSAFTNDAGYLTLSTLPIYNGGVS